MTLGGIRISREAFLKLLDLPRATVIQDVRFDPYTQTVQVLASGRGFPKYSKFAHPLFVNYDHALRGKAGRR